MGQYAVPLLIAAGAIALTYVFCLRPMRRDARGASKACCVTGHRDGTAEEIAALSREVDALRRSIADPEDPRDSPATGQADITN